MTHICNVADVLARFALPMALPLTFGRGPLAQASVSVLIYEAAITSSNSWRHARIPRDHAADDVPTRAESKAFTDLFRQLGGKAAFGNTQRPRRKLFDQLKCRVVETEIGFRGALPSNKSALRP